jgi:hypothetical protein
MLIAKKLTTWTRNHSPLNRYGNTSVKYWLISRNRVPK